MPKLKFASKTHIQVAEKVHQALEYDGLMSILHLSTAKFQLGRIIATSNALNYLTHDDILTGIARHQAGDWGCICTGDKQVNNNALTKNRRVLSAYHAINGVKYWIITEADRSITMVLLPGDD